MNSQLEETTFTRMGRIFRLLDGLGDSERRRRIRHLIHGDNVRLGEYQEMVSVGILALRGSRREKRLREILEPMKSGAFKGTLNRDPTELERAEICAGWMRELKSDRIPAPRS